MAFTTLPADPARVSGCAPDANAAQPNSCVRKRTLINGCALPRKGRLELWAGMEVEQAYDLD